MMIPDNGNKQI